MKKTAFALFLAALSVQGTLTSLDQVNPELAPLAIPAEILQNDMTMDQLQQWEMSKFICSNVDSMDTLLIDGVTKPTYCAEASTC